MSYCRKMCSDPEFSDPEFLVGKLALVFNIACHDGFLPLYMDTYL